jgi:probable biosynthetic protein (TIGR04098 family)
MMPTNGMTDYVRVVNDHCLARQVIVSPGMCSGGSLIFSRIGDWTWEAVAAACRTNVHAARTASGQPAYLSFYYYRVRGGKIVHPHGLTFGDELQVTSRVFQFGSSSVLTLHRLAPAGLDLADTLDEGAGGGVHVPVKKPARGELDIDARTRNALLRSLRYQGERGFALMSQRWRALQRVMVSPATTGGIARSALVLTQFEHKMIS